MSEPTNTPDQAGSSLYDRFQQLWSELDPALKAYRTEATELRDAPGEVTHGESLQQLHDRLVNTRRSLDRLEGIIADVGLVKSKCKQMVDDLQETYDQAWIAVMQRTRIGEYTSAKERDATYTAGALEERVRLRRGQRILDDINSIHEFCLTKFRGLTASQRDTETRLRARLDR